MAVRLVPVVALQIKGIAFEIDPILVLNEIRRRALSFELPMED